MATHETNPFKHPYPHARLRNVKLTPISRLSKGNSHLSRHLIASDDVRNYAISHADEVAKRYGWRMPALTCKTEVAANGHFLLNES